MILDSTTKSVELILGAAVTTNAMPVTADYVDLTTTTTLAGSSDTQSNGITAVTIVAPPGASTQRKVNAITVFNADTASKVVTIRLNNNTTLRNLISVTLQVGDTIGYSDTSGWYLLDSDGNLKSVQAASATSIASAIHGATNKTTTVDADEIGIWDSVTGLLNHVTWVNIKATLKAYFDTLYAALAGSATQTFSVGTATAAAHAVRLDQIGGTEMKSGSFTGTATGLTTSPTGTIIYKITNGVCHLYIPDTSFDGTSNSTGYTITGLPAACTPSADRRTGLIRATDNGGIVVAFATIVSATNTIQFNTNTAGGAWTNSGTKNLRCTDISYLL